MQHKLYQISVVSYDSITNNIINSLLYLKHGVWFVMMLYVGLFCDSHPLKMIYKYLQLMQQNTAVNI